MLSPDLQLVRPLLRKIRTFLRQYQYDQVLVNAFVSDGGKFRHSGAPCAVQKFNCWFFWAVTYFTGLHSHASLFHSERKKTRPTKSKKQIIEPGNG